MTRLDELKQHLMDVKSGKKKLAFDPMAIYMAAKNGQVKEFARLIKDNAHEPYFHFDCNGNKLIFPRRYDCEAEYGFTPLHIATKCGHVNVVEYLMEHYIAIDLWENSSHISIDRMKALLQDSSEGAAIFLAIKYNQPKIFEILLSERFFIKPMMMIEFQGDKPIEFAVKHDRIDMLRMVLASFPTLLDFNHRSLKDFQKFYDLNHPGLDHTNASYQLLERFDHFTKWYKDYYLRSPELWSPFNSTERYSYAFNRLYKDVVNSKNMQEYLQVIDGFMQLIHLAQLLEVNVTKMFNGKRDYVNKRRFASLNENDWFLRPIEAAFKAYRDGQEVNSIIHSLQSRIQSTASQYLSSGFHLFQRRAVKKLNDTISAFKPSP